MAAIRSKGMKPEMLVRSLIHRLGFRFRLHRKDLPGKPDLVFTGRRKIVFVHGCFWHQHKDPNCLDGRPPKSNETYWGPKLARNQSRDAQSQAALEAAGWKVLVVWECETRDIPALTDRLRTFLSS